jgi:uncharacterized protein YidB (DUF937 family)
MQWPDKRKVVVGAAAALAVGGAGAGIAATKLSSSPNEESKAVISDAAKQLGVQPNQLSSALKKALENRVDAAVAAGRLTKAQGDELKRRIESSDYPLIAPRGAGPGWGHNGFDHHGFRHHGFPGLDAAASYLGLSEDALHSRLESGKTLAQVAKDQGKSVDGLVAALKADLKQHLDEAVADGRLTKAQADRILSNADSRLKALVNGKFPGPPGGPGRFGRGPSPDGAGFGGPDL